MLAEPCVPRVGHERTSTGNMAVALLLTKPLPRLTPHGWGWRERSFEERIHQHEKETRGREASKRTVPMPSLGTDPFPTRAETTWRRPSKSVLSVTDWVAPAWCEYAYLYNTLSASHLPLEQRPETITTPEGNTITPNWLELVRKQTTLQRGTDVHAQIEQELQPIMVDVRVTTDEDVWALLLVEWASSVAMISETGRTREVPVCGWVHGTLVRGIIDEIYCNDYGQWVLSETKTRTTRSIPSEDDQIPARWQCMLYLRLWQGMCASFGCPQNHTDKYTTQLVWDKVWDTLGLQAEQPLSESFLEDLRCIDTPWAWTNNLTLQQLVTLVTNSVQPLVKRMSSTVEIVYVHRSSAETIGTVHFESQPLHLQAYLKRVRLLWEGQRTWEGVPLQCTHRCSHCAWRDGCEWRDKQAKQVWARVMAKKEDEKLWEQFDESDLHMLEW